MKPRRQSKRIFVGPVPIGGEAPIAVQTMTKTDTRDVAATVRQIRELEEAGCEIARLAVPDADAAEALAAIKRQVRLPLIADIHYDYRLALAALHVGMDGLRLNPGNLHDPEKVKVVVRAAKERQVPIRIGVNEGSLLDEENRKRIVSRDRGQEAIIARMVDSALAQIHLLESLDFDLIKISLKTFEVEMALAAYRAIADLMPYPLHIGITEAGLPLSGTVRSAIGMGLLLYEGLGDTIRVSLAGDPVEEVKVAYEILAALNLRHRAPILVACPSCGRVEVDYLSLARAVEERLRGIAVPIKVAVMGCVVNGPGEARDADVGLAAGAGRGAIFRKGRLVRTVDEAEFIPALLQEIDAVLAERGALASLPR
ncbi:MAG: flavodoxin-dependent (E)-4-hydroxy-3-methylbut-2-enyl-diphosphate synthase [Chloroflexi bacterium]|nr:flavodoxin-dependent (E)-4-hydroxy-3-methylbut-2-enyl-diphosphate synthase [Chloroflexota bacterium]